MRYWGFAACNLRCSCTLSMQNKASTIVFYAYMFIV